MSDLKFIEGPLNSEQLQSLMICAKLGHSTTPAVLVALLDQLDAQRLRADTAEAELAKFEGEIVSALPGVRFMDLPDGGSPTLVEQVSRMAEALSAADQRIARHESTLRHFANCADVRQVGTAAMDYVAALNPNPEAESHE